MRTVYLLAALLAGSAAFAQSNGDAKKGHTLFVRDGCFECHGYAAQGTGAGARLAATSLTAPGLIRYVRRPSGSMPAYVDKVISDQELTDIWAYVKSLPGPKPVKDIPLLNQIKQAGDPK